MIKLLAHRLIHIIEGREERYSERDLIAEEVVLKREKVHDEVRANLEKLFVKECIVNDTIQRREARIFDAAA